MKYFLDFDMFYHRWNRSFRPIPPSEGNAALVLSRCGIWEADINEIVSTDLRDYGEKRMLARLTLKSGVRLFVGFDSDGALKEWTLTTDNIGSLTRQSYESGAHKVNIGWATDAILTAARIMNERWLGETCRKLLAYDDECYFESELEDYREMSESVDFILKGWTNTDIAEGLYWIGKAGLKNYNWHDRYMANDIILDMCEISFVTAVLGDARAMREVAWSLDPENKDVRRVIRDRELATEWYRRAAEKENAVKQWEKEENDFME